MKAVVLHECGDVDQLVFEDAPDPEPQPGEALIRVRACAVNRIDLMLRAGNGMQPPLPHILGVDIAGEVGALPGDEAIDWQIGDPVAVYPWLACSECEYCQGGDESLCLNFKLIGQHRSGGYAEYVSVPIENLIRLPNGFSYASAAAACTTYLTAWRLLVTRGRVQPGETVLVLGASGGVGTAAVQIAKHRGAHVIAAVTGEAKMDILRTMGADDLIDTGEVEFKQAVRELTDKRGVDVVVDPLGGESWPGIMRSLARNGRLLSFGFISGFVAEADLRFIIWKQLSIIGSTMGSRHDADEVFERVFNGELAPRIDKAFPLSEARRAHQRMQARSHVGKLMLTPAT